MELEQLIARIGPLDEEAMAAAQDRQDHLTKPQGSLGRLESLSVQIAGILSDPQPHIVHKVVTVMAGDHGVVDEGVSAYPQAVTPQMVENFLHGGAAINVLSRHVGARVVVVDMGVAVDIPPRPGLLIQKVGYGTGNIARGPAMTRAQAVQTLLRGAEVVERELAGGLDILATGDMGIGNTTPSAAIAVALSGCSPAEIAGRGTGLDDAGLLHKVAVIAQALETNRPSPSDGLDVLSKIGGFEIGGLAGAILAAAAHRKPVVIDGFISTAAAMIAVQVAPMARNYLISAHCSQELGHRRMLQWLGVEPLLEFNMRLGEGTGAVLGISLAEAACKILCEMATFEEARVAEKSVA